MRGDTKGEERHLWRIMMHRTPAWLPAWWVVCAASVVAVRLLSPGLLEGGDGVQHYLIARYSWQHPGLFLHHWGKPLFTLFASPFAQLGHWGMALFNAVCLVLTAWAADGLLRKAGLLARWLYSPALLLVPVYGTMVLAGMTEVFFGLLTVLALRLLWDGRYVAAMVVASFTPFARPEYVAFVPFVMVWAVYRRQWKALPFLLTGHLIYGIVGVFVFGDLLWAFHQDPYTGAAKIYGHGDLFHFTDRVQDMFGMPLTWVVGSALVAGAWLWWRDPGSRPMLRLLLCVGLLPCMAVLAVHSVLWWKGWKGSLGLLRVMATIAPLLVLCALWPVTVAGGTLLRTWAGRVLGGALLVVFLLQGQYTALLAHQALPVREESHQEVLQRAGERVAALREGHRRTAYYHPQIPFHAGLNPFDPEQTRLGLDMRQSTLGLEEGDLLVWDAHFGPNEGGVPLEMLQGRDDLDLVHVLVPGERTVVLGGRPFDIWLFLRSERRQQSRTFTLFDTEHGLLRPIAHRLDTMACAEGRGTWCFTDVDFPFEINGLPLDTAGLLCAEVRVTGVMEFGGEGHHMVQWVVGEHAPAGRAGYWAQDQGAGPFDITFRTEPPSAGSSRKLYVWNPGRTSFMLRDLRVQVTHIFRPPA
jgi:hypothetical protein